MPPDNPPTVLIVDDEVLVAMFMSDLVEDAGLAVAGVARDAATALEQAAATAPAVALVDLNLRGADSGVALARRLTEAHGTAVILVSGEHGLAERPDILALAPAGIVEKPFDPDAMIRTLQTVAATARVPEKP